MSMNKELHKKQLQLILHMYLNRNVEGALVGVKELTEALKGLSLKINLVETNRFFCKAAQYKIVLDLFLLIATKGPPTSCPATCSMVLFHHVVWIHTR